jgi:hypothetical protein
VYGTQALLRLRGAVFEVRQIEHTLGSAPGWSEIIRPDATCAFQRPANGASLLQQVKERDLSR